MNKHWVRLLPELADKELEQLANEQEILEMRIQSKLTDIRHEAWKEEYKEVEAEIELKVKKSWSESEIAEAKRVAEIVNK